MKFITGAVLSGLLAPAIAVAVPAGPPTTKFSGDMTYYYAGGFGSCGYTNTSSQLLASLSPDVMKNGPNPNTNPICGDYVVIKYNGVSSKAQVVDTCGGCAKGDIMVSPAVFQKFAPLSTGRISGVKWQFK